ncbi:MAG: response regulator [Rhodospirillaceae bacterium]|nr:MAG: response regulator [Rhodospirillaceae bacterium]
MWPEIFAHGGVSSVLGLAGLGLGLVALGVAWRSAHRKPSTEIEIVLAGLLDGAAGAAVVTNGAGRTVYANSAGREWVGDQAPADFLAAHVLRDFDQDEGVERLVQAAAAGLVATAEIPLAPPGGDGRGEPDWYRVAVRPVAFGDGLILWSADDITASRTINDILSQERQDLSDFLYFLPTGVYSVDVDGRFAFVNQRFAEWLGYDVDELAGMKFDDVAAGPIRPHLDGEWRGAIQFRTRSGEILPVMVLQSTYDDAGITRTRTIVIRDAATGEAVSGRGTYERFRGLFDSAPVAIAITDGEGLIADCNQAFERLVNQSRAALAGVPLADRLVEADRRTFTTEVDKVLSGDSEGLHLDVSIMTAAGTRDGIAQASAFVGPLSASGLQGVPAEGVVAHFIDVTEQKNLEVQFAQAQKMQAMGQLAGGVAHDFNNLLTAMIGFCDLLLQRHAAGDPSFADIMQIKQNANRAANLVRQLLAFSRKQPLQPKELNVTDELTELSHLLTRLIGESIEFKLVHGRELGLIRVDPGQFDQMIINLAVNARDAMAGGGTLTIATGVETFEHPTQVGAEQVPAGRYIRVSVSDTGKGIAPENLGRIFEPFFSTKKEIPGAGTGLGLATVYGIVRQTGGFILVDSAPGQGAKFTIYLPRFTPEVEEGDARNGRAKSAGNGAARPVEETPAALDFTRPANVLLVEDEDAVRVFAARALKSKGYKVLEARTGEQALDILRDQAAMDLMITDMMMPGMDGGTLARLIRVERPEIRILLISGYSEEVARGDIVDTDDFHFLPKPFSLSQLVAKVKDVLKEPG